MLIGLHGKARSGKDTACQFILEWAEQEGRTARRDAFADRLKLSAARALGFDGTLEECVAFCNVLKENGQVITVALGENEPPERLVMTGREFLQRYGTEAHRDVFNTDFWVNAALSGVPALGEIRIFTDVRFPNEAARIRALGGEVWHILRPGNTKVDNHASEKPLPVDLIDHTIVNNGTLDHLRGLVISAIERTWVNA